MINALSQYARDEILGRLKAIAFGSEVFVSAGVGIAVGVYGPGWRLSSIKPADISTALLAYAAIAFGFCISGMALVLTLPNQNFVTWLVKERIPHRSSNGYSDLLFVFSWTALCHWLLVLFSFILLVTADGRVSLVSSDDSQAWHIFVGILFGGAAYSFIQFLLTVITLSQVGRLYINRIERKAGDDLKR